MSSLERWLPFKFRRRKAEEKKKAEAASESAPAAVTPFESFFGSPMGQLMESAFGDRMFRGPFARLAELDQWFGDFSPSRFRPNIDVVDEEDALRVTAELPGMAKEDVQLNIDGDVLTIRGEKKNVEESNENGAFRTERYYGFVQRSIPLPSNVASDKAEASFEAGVLSIRLPKTGEAEEKGKQIPITG